MRVSLLLVDVIEIHIFKMRILMFPVRQMFVIRQTELAQAHVDTKFGLLRTFRIMTMTILAISPDDLCCLSGSIAGQGWILIQDIQT
jgi:hypothetical protein